jgi:hypothetical protein
MKQFVVDFFFEEAQELFLKVYDVDAEDRLDDLSAHDFIGSCTMLLSEVLASSNSSLTKQLSKDGQVLPSGLLTLRAEEQDQTRDVIHMHLDASDVFFKTIFCFWRRPNTFIEVPSYCPHHIRWLTALADAKAERRWRLANVLPYEDSARE